MQPAATSATRAAAAADSPTRSPAPTRAGPPPTPPSATSATSQTKLLGNGDAGTGGAALTPERALDRLVGMGFDESAAIAALAQTGGRFEPALESLTSGADDAHVWSL